MTHTGTADVQLRVPTATLRAALVCLVLGAAALCCGPTLSDTVRREAHAYSEDDVRLDCEPAEMAIVPITTQRRNVALSDEDVARYSREGSLYFVYCPEVQCCVNADHGGGGVAVFCTRGASCEVVGHNLGECLTVLCATY